MKLIQLFALALIMMIAATNLAFSQSNEANQVSDSTQLTTVKVKGITCSMDLKMIAKNVEKLHGVDACQTVKKGATATFEVQYHPALVSKKEIFAAIEDTGSCENPDERPYKVKQ